MGGSVVVGLDGLGYSVPAVRWGAEEAAARDLPLHLLHSWTSQSPNLPLSQEAADKRHFGAEVLGTAEAMALRAHPDLSVTTEQVSEQAVDALVERSGQAMMTVLGSRGHGAIAGFLLGSVSLHVLGRARCPVVIVREEETAVYGRPEIVVGVQEPGTKGEDVLEFAFAAAEAHQADVRAVRAWQSPAVVDGIPTASAPAPEDDRLAIAEEEMLTGILAPWRAKFPTVGVIAHIRQGRVAAVLLEACAQAGLLVVGRRVQRTPMPLGPLVLAVLHHSPCPVAVVPRI